MHNVIRLFAQKNVEIVHSEPETRVAAAVTSVLASSAQLGRAVKELSKHFDEIEKSIDAIDDTETRSRLKQSTKTKSRNAVESDSQIVPTDRKVAETSNQGGLKTVESTGMTARKARVSPPRVR